MKDAQRQDKTQTRAKTTPSSTYSIPHKKTYEFLKQSIQSTRTTPPTSEHANIFRTAEIAFGRLWSYVCRRIFITRCIKIADFVTVEGGVRAAEEEGQPTPPPWPPRCGKLGSLLLLHGQSEFDHVRDCIPYDRGRDLWVDRLLFDVGVAVGAVQMGCASSAPFMGEGGALGEIKEAASDMVESGEHALHGEFWSISIVLDSDSEQRSNAPLFLWGGGMFALRLCRQLIQVLLRNMYVCSIFTNDCK